VLWLTGEPLDGVAADRERLRALGVAAEIVDAAALRQRFPALSSCGVPLDLGGETPHRCAEGAPSLFEPDGGYTDPVGAAQDLAEAARRDGVELRLRAEVVRVRAPGGRVAGVDLADGSGVDAPVVINAAGPWCNRLNALAGVELPWDLRPTRVQVLFRERPAELTGPLRRRRHRERRLLPARESRPADPARVDARRGRAGARRGSRRVRPRPRSRLLRGQDPRPAPPPARAAPPRQADRAGRPVHRQRAGRASGDRADNGFSGHGFKLAPMVGSMVAQRLTGRRAPFDTDVPLEFFGVDRAPLVLREKSVLA
jgi:glycine/D-amino acid oxidase-like deaminating enzyme